MSAGEDASLRIVEADYGLTAFNLKLANVSVGENDKVLFDQYSPN